MAREHWYTAKFSESWHSTKVVDVMARIEGLFDTFLKKVAAEGANEGDLVRVHISHKDIQNGDIKVSLRPFRDMNPAAITSALENYLQSNESLQFDEDFEIAAGVIQLPRGSGRKPIQRLTGPDSSVRLKQCFVEIWNQDHLCLARSLAVCEAHRQYKNNMVPEKDYKDTCNPNLRRQGKRAEELQAMAGVDPNKPSDITDIRAFENVMGAQIIVFSSRHENEIIYEGVEERETQYYLYLIGSAVAGNIRFDIL
jgi:hypothetical protein